MELPLQSLILIFSLTFHAILVLFLNLSINSEYASAAVLGNETDKLALLEFKSQITEDLHGILASWNGSIHFCLWTGVTCGRKYQRVTGLDLKGQRLAGNISPAIGNLSFLKHLHLADNSFNGGIPQELGQLIKLQNLNLSYNFLGGEIPVNLSRCFKLVNLVLDHNYLVGQVPPELGSLSYIEKLYLKNNNLTGNIPASIGNLTFVQELYLSYNNLEGEVPDSISQLRNLRLLGWSVNSLSGVFPPSLYNLSSLQLIALSFNNFTGNLRPNIGLAFPNLQKLYLGTNQFIGPIPASLSNASYLLQLDLPGNNFTGGVPLSIGNLQNIWWFSLRFNFLGSGGFDDDMSFITSLTNCSMLRILEFSYNRFGGMFPNSVTNLSTQLTRLGFGGNMIIGSIPTEIVNLVNLDTLIMNQNFLTDRIPSSLEKLSNLKYLDLSGNQFTGNLPPGVGNLTTILELYLFNNSLEGTIPSSLGNCMNLISLDISQNKFSGTIPNQLMSLPSISVLLNLSYNSLTGSLPAEVGNLTHLAVLDISNNDLSGEVPDNLGNCIAMEQLDMQGNLFQGPIPYLLGLKNIQYLDLSHNNLSGQIPQFMSNLSFLLYLNLLYNNLEGKVPVDGVFGNASAIQVFGNMNLCGGIQELHLQSCPVQEPKKHKKHFVITLILVIVSIVLCSALFCFSLALYWMKKVRNKPIYMSSLGHFYQKISYEEILNATGGFASQNLIGSGNFGTVYKGTLGSGDTDTVIAVKVLNLRQRGASKSFITECQALRNIRHRNLVKVLTVCSSIDFDRNDFKALVYQFMPNGSLEEWLHLKDEHHWQRSLNVLQRINIAIDVASALHYLHHQCETSVVHCDLKPSNVLLDNDMTALVSDFGLAKLLSKFSKEANLNQFSSLGIKGTIGYAAPQYGMGSLVSTQGDVYSYGILLLEMFTGKRPTDEPFKDNFNLHNYVKMVLPDQVMEIVDQSALYNKEVGESVDGGPECCSSNWGNDQQSECLISSVLQIGVVCSAESPFDRMNMRQVSTELLSIRDKFLGVEVHEQQIHSLDSRRVEESIEDN